VCAELVGKKKLLTDKKMNFKNFSLILTSGLSLMAASAALAETPQIEFPAPSPACTMKQRVGLTDIEVVYSRPDVKGRTIFGDVVPFDKVWRTGANKATKINFSTSVKFGGSDVPAGSYALFTIPGKAEWTVILSKVADQPGSTKYDEKDDQLRVKVKPIEIGRSVETLAINIDDVQPTSSELDIVWDKTKVPVKIEVSYKDKLVQQIEAKMASDDKDKPYFQAAAFYYENDLDIKKAKTWIDAAVKEKDLYYIVHTQAKILAKMGDKAGALAAAKHSLELATKGNDYAFERLNNELIKSLM
jgi:Holliday junction resolvase-like predicted endonuclease